MFNVANNGFGGGPSFPEIPMLRPGKNAAPGHPENPMTRVLIVDGEETVRRNLITFFAGPRYEVLEASSAGEASRLLASGEVDVVLSPSRLPEGDAVEAFTPASDADPALSVVLIAGALDAPFGSDAAPVGFDCLTKPLHPEPVRGAIDRAAERGRLRRENGSLKEEVRELRDELERADRGRDGNGNGNGNGNGGGNGSGNGNGRALQVWIASLPQSFDLRSLEADVERELVKRALAGSSGVAAQAARKLGLSRSDLAYKLRRLGIVREH
jgi:DNA-binding NtrC family response regulator